MQSISFVDGNVFISINTVINAMFSGMFHSKLINGELCWKYVGNNYFERKQRSIAQSFHLNMKYLHVHIHS